MDVLGVTVWRRVLRNGQLQMLLRSDAKLFLSYKPAKSQPIQQTSFSNSTVLQVQCWSSLVLCTKPSLSPDVF